MPTKPQLSVVPVAWSDPPSDKEGGLTIDCAECAYQHTSTCDDCVVTFLVDRDPDDMVVVDVQEAKAVRLLERAGLVPGLRHSRRVS